MKTVICVVVGVLAGVFAMSMTACNGDDTGESDITVNPPTLSFTADGNTQTVTVTCDTDWTCIASDDTWIKAVQSDNKTLTVTVAGTDAARNGNVIFTNAAGKNAFVTIKQDAPVASSDITVDPSSITFYAGGNTQTVTVTCAIGWTFTSDEWIDVAKSDNSTLTVTVGATNTAREGKITVTNIAGKDAIVAVKQESASAITANDMVGTWSVTGYGIFNDQAFTEYRTMTISKIDETTIEINGMLGLRTYNFQGINSKDVFRATISNNTISIAPQQLTPSFDQEGWPIYVCRWMNDASTPIGFEANWNLGFDNIPISADMTIDFGEGGWHIYDLPTSGMAMYATFHPLSKDPSGIQPGAYWYNLYYLNTVWTKGELPPWPIGDISAISTIPTRVGQSGSYTRNQNNL